MAWLERLAPAASSPVGFCLVHGDIQDTNLMVTADGHRYLALIDWGSACYGEPAWDFAGIPLRAVPCMLEGYRQASPTTRDEVTEPRILWRHLQLALWLMGREPQPGRSWAERPLAMFIGIMRFFLECDDPAWQPWRPSQL
jgi:Ser/Thr protein kinase RdoA (MazF antagonist)